MLVWFRCCRTSGYLENTLAEIKLLLRELMNTRSGVIVEMKLVIFGIMKRSVDTKALESLLTKSILRYRF